MSIFKKIKKGFKKLGSSIAKRMRKLGRGVKKGFAKITKAFGKLGPLGHLALFFIMPGVGNALTSWMGQMGSSVMNMLPKGFANVLGQVGGAVKSAASFAYNNTVGAVYNTVSNALTAGIDAVTGGAATNFKNFVSNTAADLSPKPVSKEIMVPVSNGQNLMNNPDLASKAEALNKALGNESILKGLKPGTIEYYDALASDPLLSKPLTELTVEDNKILTQYGFGDEGVGKDVVPKETVPEEGSVVSKYKDYKKTISDKKVLGTKVTVGESLGVAKDATQVFSAYKYFNPDEVDSGFYNPNIGMANALNQSTTNPYTTSGEDANFVNLNNVPSSPDQQASFYARMFGPVGNDPYAAAMNAPGYGFGFEDYITGA